MSTREQMADKPQEPAGCELSASAGSAHSWPEDYAHENGNYQNVCCSCGAHFIGHKRRVTCKVCHLAAVERWERMTEAERAEETAKTAKAIAECSHGPGVSECEMCGSLYPEERMNFVEDENGFDREICNSCYWNAGF